MAFGIGIFVGMAIEEMILPPTTHDESFICASNSCFVIPRGLFAALPILFLVIVDILAIRFYRERMRLSRLASGESF
jgi:hypothetical protein